MKKFFSGLVGFLIGIIGSLLGFLFFTRKNKGSEVILVGHEENKPTNVEVFVDELEFMSESKNDGEEVTQEEALSEILNRRIDE